MFLFITDAYGCKGVLPEFEPGEPQSLELSHLFSTDWQSKYGELFCGYWIIEEFVSIWGFSSSELDSSCLISSVSSFGQYLLSV